MSSDFQPLIKNKNSLQENKVYKRNVFLFTLDTLKDLLIVKVKLDFHNN